MLNRAVGTIYRQFCTAEGSSGTLKKITQNEILKSPGGNCGRLPVAATRDRVGNRAQVRFLGPTVGFQGQ